VKRGEVITVALASVIAALFIWTGAARLPIAPGFAFPGVGFGGATVPDSTSSDSTPADSATVDNATVDSVAEDALMDSASTNAPQVAVADTANLYRHPPVLVYSERMITPLLVRAHEPDHEPERNPERKPVMRAGAAINRELDRDIARARDALFRKEFDNLAHLPKTVARARELVTNARAGKKVPVSLTQYCLTGTTRRDHYVREGIVAADPRLFKLGHYVEVYLEGKSLGRFLVDDTGGNVKGATLDIWTPSCSDARRFGRQRGAAQLVAKPESYP